VSAQFNDEPALTDQLDRKAWVKWFAGNIRNCEPPYVFSVHADWGAGKTSFLWQTHYYLTGRPPVENPRLSPPPDELAEERKKQPPLIVVWFEAWRFQYDPAPIVSLLQRMRESLAWYAKTSEEARKLGEVTVRSILGFVDKIIACVAKEVVPGAEVSSSSIQQAGEKWEAEHYYTPSLSKDVHSHLLEVINKLAGNTARVVVLIDDLDRCQPEAAYKLLEGIKIYLSLPNCIFVLAMDQRQLERAIAQCLPAVAKDDANTGVALQQAREYLEKIFQDVWQLPLIAPEDYHTFLCRQLDIDPVNIAPPLDKILSILKQSSYLPANARKLKAYVNSLRRFVEHCKPYEGQDADWHARMLVIMSYFYQFHSEIYRRLEGSPGFYNEIIEWLRERRTAHAVLANIEVAVSSGDAKKKDESAENVGRGRFQAFPDPAIGNVFRIRALVDSHGVVTEDQVRHYLLRHART